MPTNVLAVEKFLKAHELGQYRTWRGAPIRGLADKEEDDDDGVGDSLNGHDSSRVNWKKRREKYQAKRERLRYLEDKGILGVIEEIERGYEAIVTDARCLFESVPARVGALIGDDELRAAIVPEVQSIVRNVLRTLARGLKQQNESGVTNGEPNAAISN